MCGIVGVISNAGIKGWTNRKNFFKQALVVDSLRGEHSTGVFTVDTKAEDIRYFKKAMAGWDFVDLGSTQSMFNNIDKHCFTVGHNRYATKGKVNNVNAHPFFHGKIIGVHNGSLWTHANISHGERFEVDSEAIFYSLDKVGEEETLKQIDGAFSLVWYNSEERTLNFIRNDKRPMYILKIKDQPTFVFGSELDMLLWLTDRNGLNVEEMIPVPVGEQLKFPYDDVTNFQRIKREIRSTASYQPYGFNSFKNKGNSQNNSVTYLPKKGKKRSHVDEVLKSKGFSRKEVVNFCLTRFQKYPNGSFGRALGFLSDGNFDDIVVHCVTEEDYHRLARKSLSGSISSYMRDKSNSDDILLIIEKNSIVEEEDNDSEVMVLGPDGHYIAIDEFNELTKYGCANCQSNISEDDHDIIDWTQDKQPLCFGCQFKEVKGSC